MRKHFFITIVIMLAIGAGITYFGFSPVASVNGDWLWNRALTKSIDAIEQLQRKSSSINLPSPAGTSTLSALGAGDIERGVLEELVYEKIIAQELERVSPSQNWEERIARDVAGLISGRDQTMLRQATRELYGLDLDDFARIVLAPQIREELLREELALRAEDPDIWLEGAFKNARVSIYFLDYEWKDGTLVEK